jgi:hypothetical protein
MTRVTCVRGITGEEMSVCLNQRWKLNVFENNRWGSQVHPNLAAQCSTGRTE